MTDRPRFYVTTAISYPNGPPHIGHAYEAIATDAIARFKRLDGYDVMFLTGVDEHGLKMAQTAAEEGLAPTEFAARNTALFNRMVDRLDVSADDFIRTTEPRHARASQAIWRRMADAGDIYLGTYSGWYSVRDEAFYAEAETTTNDAGERVSPQGTPVTWTEEQTYFFKLSEYQDRLLKHYTDNPDFIAPPERRNEIVSFVERGLQDLSISRTTFDWGVEVPDADGHVMYVWVDALTNYITGVGYPDEDSPEFQRYWPADLHVIGKDITRFHAVYWPAFLMSAGIDLPKQVFAHGFLFNRGEKMSKSVGNVVDPFAMADRYGVDPMRYFFLREVPFGQDGSYSHEAIVGRINADLANDLGNLAQRSLSMVAKNCDRSIPEPGSFLDADKALLDQVDGLLPQLRESVEARALHTSLSTLWACVAEANRYFAAQEPWALRKSDPQRMATVLYVTAETLRQIAVLAQAVMPTAMASLLNLLGVAQDARSFDVLGPAGRLQPGTKIEPPKPVFPRYIEEDADDR